MTIHQIPPTIRKIKLDDDRLGLSKRVAYILLDNNICTIGGLLTKSFCHLRTCRGLGETSINELRSALAKFGLSLKEDPETYPVANPCPLCGSKRDVP